LHIKKLFEKISRRAPNLKKLHLQSFPAIHIKKMDWMDFVLKFSGELLVILLSILVAGLNIFFFTGNSYKDLSLAGSFISRHPVLNQKVYAKNTSIVTVVSQNSFLPQAYADNFAALTSPGGEPDVSAQQNDSGTVIDDAGGIVAPSPDSIKAMVSSVTKKVYITRAGDTIQSIAAANNISTNSIRWSNPLLTSDTLQPGWSLIIPPVDGVAVTAGDNTTLPDLAAQYNPLRYSSDKQARDNSASQLLATIISYNGLDSAEDINPGDFLIIPGGVVATPPPAPKPAPKPKSNSKPAPDNSINDITSIGSGYDGINHLFPRGYCTYYVATKMKITFGGNAKNWLANAGASGYVVGQEPAPHSAVVMTGSKGALRRYGHVAYVESINGDETITVSEMNYDHFNRVDTRTVSVHDSSIRGYIYP
jgi:surface antigen